MPDTAIIGTGFIGTVHIEALRRLGIPITGILGASVAWASESPDHLWLGHRDAPNQTLTRDPSLMNPYGTAATHLPGGHVEGFADTFRALFAQIHANITTGTRRPSYASFADGHFEMQFCDAVLRSAISGTWEPIT